jgi:hypothetical protein
MGHSRLGTLPMTQPWQEVVRVLGDGANVPKVAEAVLYAAQRALGTVQDDPGFREAVHLMVQVAVAGTKDDPVGHLQAVGIELGEGGSIAEMAAAVSEALDRRMSGKGQRSDFGEMARGALVAVVSDHLANKGTSLFGKPEDLAAELRGLHTPKRFGALAQQFFGTMANSFLRYFLDKTLGTHVGAGQRFATMNQLAVFEGALRTHCDEAAAIVNKFCGDWLSKRRFEDKGIISRESAEKFAWVAVKKIRLELAERSRKRGS